MSAIAVNRNDNNEERHWRQMPSTMFFLTIERRLGQLWFDYYVVKGIFNGQQMAAMSLSGMRSCVSKQRGRFLTWRRSGNLTVPGSLWSIVFAALNLLQRLSQKRKDDGDDLNIEVETMMECIHTRLNTTTINCVENVCKIWQMSSERSVLIL